MEVKPMNSEAASKRKVSWWRRLFHGKTWVVVKRYKWEYSVDSLFWGETTGEGIVEIERCRETGQERAWFYGPDGRRRLDIRHVRGITTCTK
jgi:hypothetical protein